METSSHTLNERLKRLEPTTKVCSYCVDGKMNDINESYFIPVYKENDRTNVVVYRSVKYSMIKVGVPRCLRCKAIHEGSKNKALVIALIASILLLAFAVYNFMEFNVFVSVALFFGSIAGGIFGYAYLQNIFARKQGIYALKDGAKNDPMVENLLNSGWTLNMPTA